MNFAIALVPIAASLFRHGKMKFNPALGVEMPEESQPKPEPIFDRDEEAHLHQPRNLKEKLIPSTIMQCRISR